MRRRSENSTKIVLRARLSLCMQGRVVLFRVCALALRVRTLGDKAFEIANGITAANIQDQEADSAKTVLPWNYAVPADSFSR